MKSLQLLLELWKLAKEVEAALEAHPTLIADTRAFLAALAAARTAPK